MKYISIIAVLAIIWLPSCKKDEENTPEPQKVTYDVTCDNCLIYVEDDTWNSSNPALEGKYQKFVVDGKFKYTFENTKLDSVTVRVYLSTFALEQQVYASITDNRGKSSTFNGILGFSRDPLKTNPNKATLGLKLK